MDKNELERRLEAAEKQIIGLQDEITNLKAKLNEVQEDEIPGFPVFDNEDSFIFDEYWNLMKSEYRRFTSESYDVFHTAEYAQLFADKCREIAMLLHCKWYIDRDFIQDWSDPIERKWQLYYDHDEKKMVVGAYSLSDFGVVFSTEENAQKCADWLNEHWKEDGNGTD